MSNVVQSLSGSRQIIAINICFRIMSIELIAHFFFLQKQNYVKNLFTGIHSRNRHLLCLRCVVTCQNGSLQFFNFNTKCGIHVY